MSGRKFGEWMDLYYVVRWQRQMCIRARSCTGTGRFGLRGRQVLIAAILVGTSVEAAPAKEPPTRCSKRGPRAWEHFLSAPLLPLRDGGTTRLLVHAIGDASVLQWIPKVKEFLASSKLSGTDLTLPNNMDMALAQYMDWQCYGEQLSPSSGTLLLFGLVCLLPEIKGRLPLAARSLKSWARLAVTSEGGPVPEEIIFLVTIDLIENGLVYEGCWALCQFDMHGREQEMEQLQGADIHWDGKSLDLELGQAVRGESVKTGHNQGVLLRRAEVIDIMLALREAAGQHKVFPITQEKLRQSWHRTMRKLGLSYAGPPHAIRHSGPSEDLLAAMLAGRGPTSGPLEGDGERATIH